MCCSCSSSCSTGSLRQLRLLPHRGRGQAHEGNGGGSCSPRGHGGKNATNAYDDTKDENDMKKSGLTWLPPHILCVCVAGGPIAVRQQLPIVLHFAWCVQFTEAVSSSLQLLHPAVICVVHLFPLLLLAAACFCSTQVVALFAHHPTASAPPCPPHTHTTHHTTNQADCGVAGIARRRRSAPHREKGLFLCHGSQQQQHGARGCAHLFHRQQRPRPAVR
jgi:hypothetical protein